MTHSNMFEEVKCINTLKDIFNYLSTFQFYGFLEDYSFKPYKYYE